MHFKVNFTNNQSQSLFFSVDIDSIKASKASTSLSVHDKVFPFPFAIYFSAADFRSQHRVFMVQFITLLSGCG